MSRRICRKMCIMLTVFFILFQVLFIDSQDGQLCGSPAVCTCFTEPYVIDCGKRSLNEMPYFEETTMMFTIGAYFNDNDIKFVPDDYFTVWISLIFLDISENDNLKCQSLQSIPAWVTTVKTDCLVATTEYETSTAIKTTHLKPDSTIFTTTETGAKTTYFKKPDSTIFITTETGKVLYQTYVIRSN